MRILTTFRFHLTYIVSPFEVIRVSRIYRG